MQLEFQGNAAIEALSKISNGDVDGVHDLARSVGSLIYEIPGILDRPVSEFQGVFYFSDKRPMKRSLRKAVDAKLKVEATLDCPPICLLIDFDCGEAFFNQVCRPYSGFGYIRFNAYQPDQREFMHEIGHCGVYSKFALLDEGIACFFENHAAEDLNANHQLPPTSVLELCNLSAGLNSIGGLDSYRRFDFYHVAARLISVLFQKLGGARLFSLISSANFLENGEALYRVLLQELEITGPGLDHLLNIRTERDIPTEPTKVECEALSRELLINGDVDLAEKIIGHFDKTDLPEYERALRVSALIVYVLSHPDKAIAFQLSSAIREVISIKPRHDALSAVSKAIITYREIFETMELQNWPRLMKIADDLSADHDKIGDSALQTAIFAKLMFGSPDLRQGARAMAALAQHVGKEPDDKHSLQDLLERFERAWVFLAPNLTEANTRP